MGEYNDFILKRNQIMNILVNTFKMYTKLCNNKIYKSISKHL